MSVEPFGALDGETVWQVTLRAPSGACARIITWGAVLRELLVPARGGYQGVVLGLNSPEDYRAHSPYFGAIVGRYANRIGSARFRLDGQSFALDANEGPNQLHGGTRGFGQRLWTLLDHGTAHATLALVSADGDMGYPGRLTATCTYRLLEPATLRLDLEAVCDRPTPVNLTTHAYYNLDGSPTILDHSLEIAGRHVTPTEADLIPTGAIQAVAGTPHDFTAARPIGSGQPAYDVNYVLEREAGSTALARAATLAAPSSGIRLDLWTTEPGLQFYNGHMLDVPVPGLDGRRYGRHGGLVLEPQRFPDGPNRSYFPPCILWPGEVSRQSSELRFSLT